MINEGGELGYALATAFGAALDNPDLLVACIVGDGEAETGPTATAWHSTKFLDPATDGAVLPILHLNGFKIASPTIFATMADDELNALFTGYGYAPRLVDYSEHLDGDLAAALAWTYAEIRRIQQDARAGRPADRPRWPMLILRTPKGLGGPKEIDGHAIEEGASPSPRAVLSFSDWRRSRSACWRSSSRRRTYCIRGSSGASFWRYFSYRLRHGGV